MQQRRRRTLDVVRADRHQAATWQHLAYAQLVSAVFLIAFAGLAVAGLVGVPPDGWLGPVLMAVVLVGLNLRSLPRARGLRLHGQG